MTAKQVPPLMFALHHPNRISTNLVATTMVLLLAARAPAQSPDDFPFPANPSAPTLTTPTDATGASDSAVPESQDEEALQEEIDRWIEELGSSDFATRERAATQLTEIGGSIVTRLQPLVDESPDAEVRIRASQIIKQLTQGDLQLKVDRFLAGKDVPFEGWRITRAILGDTLGVRELFVEMVKSYPELPRSLEGTPRDRAMALEKVVAAVHHKIFVDRQFPSSADAISLLLPASDPNVPLNGDYEDLLLAVLNKPAGSKLHQDFQLSGPFTGLLARWLPRSTVKNREDILFYGLNWQLEATLPLALQTLDEVQQPDTLELAFQVIARFGDVDDAPAVARFLDDKRIAAERGFANGKRLRTEMGDIAMATIARLHSVPLIEIGFARESEDPKFAFALDDLGFPVGDESARQAARAKIDQLLAPPVEPERL